LPARATIRVFDTVFVKAVKEPVMLAEQTEFALLMQRVRDGCPQAAQEVFDRYSDHIRRVVRRRLHQPLRRRLDSTDFLQSVWAAFFRTPAQYVFGTPEELIGFLAALAQNKLVDAFRRNVGNTRRDIRREQPLPTASDSVGREHLVLAGRQPTPSQVAVAQERWELLLADQPPENRRVLELLRQRYSPSEIVEHLNVHPKRLQRVIRRLMARMEQT
jgi:RNA polymerase sigma-70 factor (ECF subfamily)